jgi:hypothetical protein
MACDRQRNVIVRPKRPQGVEAGHFQRSTDVREIQAGPSSAGACSHYGFGAAGDSLFKPTPSLINQALVVFDHIDTTLYKLNCQLSEFLRSAA